jgi:hypothetical protein
MMGLNKRNILHLYSNPAQAKEYAYLAIDSCLKFNARNLVAEFDDCVVYYSFFDTSAYPQYHVYQTWDDIYFHPDINISINAYNRYISRIRPRIE